MHTFTKNDHLGDMGLIDSAISNFVSRNASAGTVAESKTDERSIIRIRLPIYFKDQA